MELTQYEYYKTNNGVLYKGDCLQVMKAFPDESFDMILTDPPYGINYKSNRSDNHDYIQNDKKEDWEKLMPSVLMEYKRLLKPTGVCCVFCGGGGGVVPATAIFTMEAIKHLKLIQILVWKKYIGLGHKYRPAYENIAVLARTKEKYNFFDTSKKCSNVIEGFNQVIPTKEDHPTKKPVKLLKRLLEIHTIPGMKVLDSFAGGGSTLIACETSNRQWVGIELEEKYCQIARRDLEIAIKKTTTGGKKCLKMPLK